MGIFMKRRWQSVLVAFVFAFTSVTTLLTQSASAVAGDIEQWQTATNELPVGVGSGASVEINGYLYVIGADIDVGESSTYPTSIYYTQIGNDGQPGQWLTNSTILPNDGLSNLSAFTANGHMYVVGTDMNSFTAQVFYAVINSNGTLGEWTTVNTPTQRAMPSSIIVNDYLYIIGGSTANTSDPNNPVNDDTYYAKINTNGTIGNWQTTEGLPYPVYFANAVTHGDYIYMIGGFDRPGTGEPVPAYDKVSYTSVNSDGTLDTWQESDNPLPVTRGVSVSAIINDYIYVISGAPNYHPIPATDTVFFSKLNSDGTNGTWQTSINPLPTEKLSATITTVDNRMYVIGGAIYDNNYIVDTSLAKSVYFTSAIPQSLATPMNLTASTPTNQEPILNWSSVTGATSYTIYRNDSSVGTSSTTSFTDTSLSADGNYTYTVAASNGSISSPQSSPVTVQYDTTLPTATGPTISGWLVVNWGNPVITASAADALSGVTGGEYYIDNDPGQGNGSPMTYANGKIRAQPVITTGTANGWHTIYMRSQDTAGNWSTPTSVRFFFF